MKSKIRFGLFILLFLIKINSDVTQDLTSYSAVHYFELRKKFQDLSENDKELVLNFFSEFELALQDDELSENFFDEANISKSVLLFYLYLSKALSEIEKKEEFLDSVYSFINSWKILYNNRQDLARQRVSPKLFKCKKNHQT